jgi:hypothetical protein
MGVEATLDAARYCLKTSRQPPVGRSAPTAAPMQNASGDSRGYGGARGTLATTAAAKNNTWISLSSPFGKR